MSNRLTTKPQIDELRAGDEIYVDGPSGVARYNIPFKPTRYGGILTTDFDSINVSGFYTGVSTAVGAPNTSENWFVLHFNSNAGTAMAGQIAFGYTTQRQYYRRKESSIWGAWVGGVTAGEIAASVLKSEFVAPTVSGITFAASTSHDATLSQSLALTSLTPTFANVINGYAMRNFLSGTFVQVASSTHTSGGNEYADLNGGFEILIDAPVIELELSDYLSANGPWISVETDDGYAGRFLQNAATSGVVYMKFTHPRGRASRRWRFSGLYGSFLWRAINVDSISICTKPSKRRRVVFMGDSIGEGYNATVRADGYAPTLGKILQSDLVNCSRTGTGILEPGPSTGYYNFTNRWTRDIVGKYTDTFTYVFQGSVNDAAGVGSVGGFTEAQAVAAWLALWQAARTESPSAHICVMAPVGYVSNANVISLSAAMKVAFDGWADGNSSWFDSRAIFSAANASTYFADAVVHPNEAGHLYLAGHVARHLESVFSA